MSLGFWLLPPRLGLLRFTAVRGFGGAICLTAFVNRSQPSGLVSISSGFSDLGLLAMTEKRYQNRIKVVAIADPHFRGIGLVAYSWSVLEGAIERIVWRAAGLENEHIAVSVTTHTNIQTRLDSAKTLLNHLFPNSDATTRLKRLDKHIRKQLMGRRNEIVHSRIVAPFFPDDTQFVRTVYRARGDLIRKIEPIELSEYEEVSSDILAAATEARDIISLVIDLKKPQSDDAPSP